MKSTNALQVTIGDDGMLLVQTDLPWRGMSLKSFKMKVTMLKSVLHPDDIKSLVHHGDADSYTQHIAIELNPHLKNIGEVLVTIHGVLSALGVGPIDCSQLSRVN